MSNHTGRAHDGAIQRYGSTYEDAYPPPPIIAESPAQPAATETNLGFVLTIANLGMTALLIVAMLRNGSHVRTAILVGGAYFATTSTAVIFVLTGALTAMVNAWQRERTERLRVLAYRELGEMAFEWKLACEETRQMELAGRRPPAAPAQRVSPLNTYVAPIADGEEAQVEAVRFAMSLFDTMGRPSRDRLHPGGRLRIRMIGSKRGAGSREAGLWLLREGIVKRVKGGYALNLVDYPTRESLRKYL